MGTAPQEFSLETTATLEALSELAQFLEEKSQALGLSSRDRQALELTADEAVTNVINYAYPEGSPGPVRVRLAKEGDWLVMTIEDDGEAFNPVGVEAPDLDSSLEERRIGGLGLYLMEKMMDRVERTRSQGVNRLVLSKKL